MSDIARRPLPKMVVAIVDRERFKQVTDLFCECHMHYNFICLARGTASSEIMDLLGLGTPEKALIVGFGSSFSASVLTRRLEESLPLKKRGGGIAFTMPISGVSNLLSQMMSRELDEFRKEVESAMEKEAEGIKKEAKYQLVIAVINQGFSEDVMAAAKKAGATGGTVLHARRGGVEQAEKFFGISIQEEKEIVAILSTSETRQDIMHAVSSECGVKSEAKGIILSMPVDSMIGVEL